MPEDEATVRTYSLYELVEKEVLTPIKGTSYEVNVQKLNKLETQEDVNLFSSVYDLSESGIDLYFEYEPSNYDLICESMKNLGHMRTLKRIAKTMKSQRQTGPIPLPGLVHSRLKEDTENEYDEFESDAHDMPEVISSKKYRSRRPESIEGDIKANQSIYDIIRGALPEGEEMTPENVKKYLGELLAEREAEGSYSDISDEKT